MPRPVADLLGEGGAAVAAFGRPLMTSGATSGADREELRRVVAASPELSRRALAEVRAGLAGDPRRCPPAARCRRRSGG
ncbi:MAG TPA: hypothetical protein VOB72_07285 [Candidatus Dormibacteraeota bacterium]|nr:hypothetical protein [Candidatus Dormibacteraeota bacterium]